jgi:hypothetical protein
LTQKSSISAQKLAPEKEIPIPSIAVLPPVIAVPPPTQLSGTTARTSGTTARTGFSLTLIFVLDITNSSGVRFQRSLARFVAIDIHHPPKILPTSFDSINFGAF